MGKRKQPKGPPLQRVVLIRGSEAFNPRIAREVVSAVRQSPKMSAVWIAEALNDATTNYFSKFADTKSGVPSENRAWARELAIAADTCLRMLVPDAPEGELPRVTDHRVHSALFHMGEPPGHFSFVPGAAADFEYSPIRDLLDSLPRGLFHLKRMAEHAEEQWHLAAVPRECRRQPDQAILTWVTELGDIYWRVFAASVPVVPTTKSPFVKFAEAVRPYAVGSSATEHGTDSDARDRLQKLTPARLASMVREHHDTLEKRWQKARSVEYVPQRIKLGVVTDDTSGN